MVELLVKNGANTSESSLTMGQELLDLAHTGNFKLLEICL